MTTMTAPTPSKLVTEPVRSGVAAEIRAITALRHELHQIPEVMFTEHKTSGLVQRELKALGIEHRGGLAGGTGVLGWLPRTPPASIG